MSYNVLHELTLIYIAELLAHIFSNIFTIVIVCKITL